MEDIPSVSGGSGFVMCRMQLVKQDVMRLSDHRMTIPPEGLL
jgi:hypothetical protein